MRNPRKPSAFEWLFCIAVFLAGAALIWTYLAGRWPGNLPENQLTLAEGAPTKVSESRSSRSRSVSFTIAGYPIKYDGDEPEYQEVLSVVQSLRPMRVWVSKQSEALIPLEHWVTLYKLNVGDKPVLTYAETVAYHANSARVVPILGSVIMGLGAITVFGCFYSHRRYTVWVSTGSDKGQIDPLKKVMWGTILVSAAIYAVIVGVNFAPEVRAKQVEAFGAQPLGFPVTLTVEIVETALFLPIPWVSWHAMRIAYRGHLDGRRFSILYLLVVGERHPDLRRSQMICFGGLLYFAVLVAAWIIYAASHGI